MRQPRTITAEGIKLAIFVPSSAWKPGLNFLSEGSDFIQVGTWSYTQGTRLGPHIHNIAPREGLRTQEAVYVRQGRLRAYIFTEKGEPTDQITLEAGDLLIVLAGGHGYEVLEDGTVVLEVKNGPYIGIEQDRRKIPWHDSHKGAS